MPLVFLATVLSAALPREHGDTSLVPALPPSVASTSYVSTFTILSQHPHCSTEPCNAFTEGLAFDAAGNLYESNGGYEGTPLRGLRQVDLATGDATTHVEPADGQFVEGMTVLPNNHTLQLTYREGQVNVYQTAPLQRVTTVTISLGREGWGLTHSEDGGVLYMTDSTDQLLHVNASTLEVLRRVRVTDARLGNKPIYGVNELERVGNEVWGNVYPTCSSAPEDASRREICDYSDCVVRIDPATGSVKGWVDLTSLREHETDDVRADQINSVLNGIAYHAATDRLLLTGKNWRLLYRVSLSPTEKGEEHVRSVCRLAS